MQLDWQRLAWMGDEELARHDIAAVNLACAEGLPGAPTPRQVAECLDRLDHYARCVADYTRRCLPDFHARRGHYHGSLAKFKMICLLRLLQDQFWVLYNEEKVPHDVPLDTADTFIHGALLGPGGTCASLPVVYAAVGRRLGYPLRLVTATGKDVGHLFVRWDEPGGERFNFEANNHSCDTPPDDHYRGLYGGMTPEVERAGGHLVSLPPRRELAGFLAARAFRWRDLNRPRLAVQSFAWALALSPNDRTLLNTLAATMYAWDRWLAALGPPGFPEVILAWPPSPRFPPTLPEGVEADILKLEAWENALNEPEYEAKYWLPMRRGLSVRRPSFIRVEPFPGGCTLRPSFQTYGCVVTT